MRIAKQKNCGGASVSININKLRHFTSEVSFS